MIRQTDQMKPNIGKHLSLLIGFSIVVFTTVFCGCASAPPIIPEVPEHAITPQDRELLKAPTAIQLVHIPGPPFEFKMNAKGLLFLIGGIYTLPTAMTADKREAEKAQKEFQLEDPVLQLKQRFFANLTSHIRPLNASILADPITSTMTGDLNKVVQTGFAFVFQTTVWQVSRDSSIGWRHYRTIVGATAQLIEPEKDKILWQSNCRFVSKDATSIVELRADNGALLKLKLKEAAESCADELWAKFLQ